MEKKKLFERKNVVRYLLDTGVLLMIGFTDRSELVSYK
jgi:hypothetical protein